MIWYLYDADGFYTGAVRSNTPPSVSHTDVPPPDDYAQWQGGAWIPNAREVPVLSPAELLAAERASMVCSRFQAKAALHQAGLLQAVNDAMADADPVAQLAWTEAVEFRRNSPTINALAVSLGLTDEQLDDLFRSATQIEA